MKAYYQLLFAFLITFIPFKLAVSAFLFDPALQWQTLRTEHFEIHYHDQERALAEQVAAIAERAYRPVTEYFAWTPQEPTQIVLIDRMDFSNGFAFPQPRNTMMIFAPPPDTADVLSNYHDWLDLVITHEFTHIVHIDKVRGIPARLRNVFGRLTLLFPNAFQPAWIVEGIATHQESQLAEGTGRGHNSLFSAMMRLDVINGIKPVAHVNQPTVTWPSGHLRYLYGMYFFEYLNERYDEKTIKRWFDNYSDNIIPFFINNNSMSTFSKSISAHWLDYQQYLVKRFTPHIDAIRAQGLSEGEQLSHAGYLTGTPRRADDGLIYYVQDDFLSATQLIAYNPDDRSTRRVARVYGNSFDIHTASGALFSELDFDNSTNLYSDLYVYNLTNGERRQLTFAKRYKYAAWRADGEQIIAVHTALGVSALHLLDKNGNLIEILWQGGDFEVLSDITWSADSQTVVASVWRPSTRWELESFDLHTRQWTRLTHSRENEFNPQFIENQNAVLYSADFEGVYNIYRYDLSSHAITQLTQVMGAALSATSDPSGKGIYYTGLTPKGSDIFYMPQPLQKPPPDSASYEPFTPIEKPALNPNAHYTVTNYNALAKLKPTQWFPYVFLEDERSEYGFSTFAADPLLRHQMSLIAAYDTDNEWTVGRLDYVYDRWHPTLKLMTEREVTAIEDSLGLRGFQVSDTFGVEAVLPYIRRQRQWAWHVGASVEEINFESKRAGLMQSGVFRDKLLGVAMTFNSAEHYPLGISLENGQQVRLVAEDSDTLNSTPFNGQVYTLDWRGFLSLPFNKQVLVTRLAAGWGTDNPRAFQLGGVSENFFLPTPAAGGALPAGDIFNKRDYALRGYKDGLTDLSGRRMLLMDAEWRFPIALIERGFMAPPIGIHQLHGALFINSGDAWDTGADKKFLTGAGVEINAELVFGYLIPFNVRLGFASGFDELGEDKVYLQLGGTF